MPLNTSKWVEHFSSPPLFSLHPWRFKKKYHRNLQVPHLAQRLFSTLEISKFEISLMSPIFTGSHRYKNHPFTSLSPYPSWGKKRKMWKRSEVSVARWVAVFAKTTSEFSMFQQNLEKLKFWRRKKWKKKLSKSIPSIYLDYNKFNHPWQASLTFSRWCNLMALVSIASEIGKSQFP